MCPGPKLAATLLLVLGTAGCERPHQRPGVAKATPPAKVEKLPGEGDLTTVTLTPEAEASLALATAAVERKDVPRTRTVGGEVVVPPGRSIAVSAPVGGTLLAPDGEAPAPGAAIKKGQVVFRLLPLLAPEARATVATARVDAQGQVDQAEKQEAQSRIQLERAERLRRDGLGGSGALVDAQAQFEVASATLQAAQARRDGLDALIRDVEGGALTPLPIAAEADGTLKFLHALVGQKVAAGAPLFELVRLDRVWIRVPLYVGDAPAVAAGQDAAVGGLADPPGGPSRAARPVPAPPSGDPLASTVDLFYEVDNRDGAFRPGQRVGVTLTLQGERESLVVPRAAVVRDFDGGAWVYEGVGPHRYARRRVRVDRVVGPLAVLASGPQPGARVVTDGAAELFGTEFGGAK